MVIANAARAQPIQVGLKTIGQLFHTLDPLPFRERELDSGLEEYVVGWAGEMVQADPISIVIHLPRTGA